MNHALYEMYQDWEKLANNFYNRKVQKDTTEVKTNIDEEFMEENRYAALDFETMDTWRASVCSVGCVIFENNEIVDEFYSLVCPPSKYENPHCVEVHGLHYKDVKDSPPFPEVWETVDKMIGNSPIIAHNAGFEKGCINACNEEFGTKKDYKFIDTLQLSRQYMPYLNNHKLDTVCKQLKVPLKEHHNALEDARACGKCLIEMKNNKKK